MPPESAAHWPGQSRAGLVRLEREVEALHKERDAAQMLERYGEAKRLGVRPSRQTSLFLLSALAMSSSPALVGRIYGQAATARRKLGAGRRDPPRFSPFSHPPTSLVNTHV